MMRKTIGFVLLGFSIAIVFFWVYDSRKATHDTLEPHPDMYVKPAVIPEETKKLLNVIGQNVLLFDLEADPEQANVIRIWLEHFEGGTRQENVIDFGSGISVLNAQGTAGNDYAGQLLLSIRQYPDERQEERTLAVTAAVLDQGGSSSTSRDVHLPLHTGSRLQWTNYETIELSLHQPITLSLFLEDDGSSLSHSDSSVQQYDATGRLPEELARLDRLLLFRIMLEGNE